MMVNFNTCPCTVDQKVRGRVVLQRVAPGRYLCRCHCGTQATVSWGTLRYGKGLGCKTCATIAFNKSNKKTHGLRYHPLYYIWQTMFRRCHKPRDYNYKNYGARGIQVCEEWRQDFKVFYGWSKAHGYVKGLHIDRKDNEGNYEPSNCQYVTAKVNANNKRSNVILTHEGVSLTMAQWSDRIGVQQDTLRRRLKTLGWSVARALTTPTQSRDQW